MTKSGQRLAVSELAKLHVERLAAIEAASEPVYAIPSEYPAGYHVKPHRHSRAQFVYARAGVVMVSSVQGRWMVPPQHALWIPAGLVHMVDMLGDVTMLSAYVAPNALADPPTAIRVVALTDLARALIIEAAASPSGATSGRHDLVMALLLEEVLRLPDRPLGLPFPSDARLAALCRGFIENPSARLLIDDWAERLAMSRRAFTRFFRKETGISLSTWRQQAAVFTALPRLAAGEAVTAVAIDLGYDSVAAFTTMFRRMLGAAPRAYFKAPPEQY
ncbi:MULTISPECIES: AraC family transcriptional regulator [Rhizobium]|uniref:HTH-type transcriptional activator rhaS n=1 Tax=Rhizobium favelukesii TaxID=348824 RepID=W6R9W4_9HYPH|nr:MULTISPECIES: helix-turn-helix transcriptional regulator [Rhizobium]MCA0802260.1 helix-turn-helix transcriptional regulator [Rhizobium sp. T1473]MCS0460367.1 helix-turn-helix transcriptional regulator [Rhizobium favelukesii]UFS80830.1 helix-turn-helix transcriptional regulator [Rhizobium sp. T136]CDM57709.1 HTH-type transcriptional activator rhaS [Rhizobium favelukesii]